MSTLRTRALAGVFGDAPGDVVAAFPAPLRDGQVTPSRGASPHQPDAEPMTVSQNCPGGRLGCDGQYLGEQHTCPLPDGMPAADYADQRGDDRTKAMLADLQTAIQAIVESGQLQRWLDAMASNGLNRWSLNNRLLAIMQLAHRGGNLEDAHMMGFRQWEKLDRHVRGGEKAIWILAPMTRKIREEAADGTTKDKNIVTGFKSVPVFNVSQTEGAPLPDPPLSPPHGEATPGTLDGLRERVGAAGYHYEETVIPDCVPATGRGTLGYTDPATKRIVVDQRLSGEQKASTIAHEPLTALLARMSGGMRRALRIRRAAGRRLGPVLPGSVLWSF